MFKDFDEAIIFVQKNAIKSIDLKFSDLWGRWHHVTIGIKEFNSNLMKNGIGFDGSSVGFKSVQSGDMALVPDLSTGQVDSFWDQPTLSFICNVVEADSKIPFNGDPRRIAFNAEKYLVDSGIADESFWGPEFEFYIFNKVHFENKVNSVSYRFESQEVGWTSGIDELGYLNPSHGGYHAIPPRDQFFKIREEMVTSLEAVGITVKYHHHEVGGPGQCEIETPLMNFLQTADTCMNIKYLIRMVAWKHNLSVSFLPKPLFGEAGSGMHFHQQLFKNHENLFYDPKGPDLLSETALYYIGGLLSHAPAVLGFTNSSTNSYRRLIPGFEAPVNCFFSSGNRSAAIRVPRYARDPNKVRFEFRPPDATCNPYLAISAMLLAGLDGIQKKTDPTKAGFGPIDEDIFSISQQKRNRIKSLPSNLEGALLALKNDHEFLLQGDVFTEDLIQLWILHKQQEAAEVNNRPHPYEIQMYYDM